MKKKEIIKELSKKYFYNKETGAITCKVVVEYIDVPLFDVMPPYKKVRRKEPFATGTEHPSISCGVGWGSFHITAVGTATPAGEDTYDKALGERIAYAKAMRKIYRIMYKWFQKQTKELRLWLKQALQKGQTMESFYKRESEYIQSLL